MNALWLAMYDIREPTRLRKVATLCEDYGRRLQYSVFLCLASREHMDELRDTVSQCIDSRTDHFMIVPLCQRCQGRIDQLGITVDLPGATDCLIV